MSTVLGQGGRKVLAETPNRREKKEASLSPLRAKRGVFLLDGEKKRN